jgi:hypothetical protein
MVLPDHIARVEDVNWLGDDGIRYLQPEIVFGLQGTSPSRQGRGGLRGDAPGADRRSPRVDA